MKHVFARLMRQGLTQLVGLTSLVLILSAHIGSPDVWIESNAGPYPVVVNVQVPTAIPGVADVYIQVKGENVTDVLASGNTFEATGGAPPPEIAKPVEGMPGMYHARVWMMTSGSSSITVTVRGSQGEGTLLVPVVTMAYERLTLNPWLGFAFSALGIILFLGAISMIGAIVRESVLVPGVTPDPSRKRIGRIAMGSTAIVLSVLLFGGWTWWSYEDKKIDNLLYQPLKSESRLRKIGAISYLDIVITDSMWVNRNKEMQKVKSVIVGSQLGVARRRRAIIAPIVPDHGKLMHTFLIRSDMNALAHIHPTTTDSLTFSTLLPPLPPGKYRVLADIVRESGYTETLVSTVTIPEGEGTRAGTDTQALSATSIDPDDAWVIGPPSTTDTVLLAPNLYLRWERNGSALTEKMPAPLNFSVTDAAGNPVTLEPYMGMSAHAMVLRDDASVFVHLHPTGTISMAAQEAFAVRQPSDTVRGMVAKRMKEQSASNEHQGHQGMSMSMTSSSTMGGVPAGDTTGKVRFPYAFPKPGNYRVWVQAKVAGKILTGSFPAVVKTAEKR